MATAKLFKFSGYFVDPNGAFDASTVKADLAGIGTRHVQVEEVDLGEWDDDFPINRRNCPVEVFEWFFKEVPADGTA